MSLVNSTLGGDDPALDRDNLATRFDGGVVMTAFMSTAP